MRPGPFALSKCPSAGTRGSVSVGAPQSPRRFGNPLSPAAAQSTSPWKSHLKQQRGLASVSRNSYLKHSHPKHLAFTPSNTVEFAPSSPYDRFVGTPVVFRGARPSRRRLGPGLRPLNPTDPFNPPNSLNPSDPHHPPHPFDSSN